MHRLTRDMPALRAYGLSYCEGVASSLVEQLAARLGLPEGDPALRMLVEVVIAAWHQGAKDWELHDRPGTAEALARRLAATFAVIPGSMTITA
jgi:hypothetical protein